MDDRNTCYGPYQCMWRENLNFWIFSILNIFLGPHTPLITPIITHKFSLNAPNLIFNHHYHTLILFTNLTSSSYSLNLFYNLSQNSIILHIELPTLTYYYPQQKSHLHKNLSIHHPKPTFGHKSSKFFTSNFLKYLPSLMAPKRVDEGKQLEESSRPCKRGNTRSSYLHNIIFEYDSQVKRYSTLIKWRITLSRYVCETPLLLLA